MYRSNVMGDEFIYNVNMHVPNLLLEKGYDALTHDQKNDLAVIIADEENILLAELTPESILDYHKKIKIIMLKDKCNESIEEGFEAFNGHFYRTNRNDQINMIGQKDMLNDDENITEILWKTEDAGYVNHTREEWLTVYREAFNSIKAKIFKYDRLKNLVIECEDHESIVGIDWDGET